MKLLALIPTVFAIGLGGYTIESMANPPGQEGTVIPTSISECQLINEPGPYALANNLPGKKGLLDAAEGHASVNAGDCLVINSKNVTIDGNGFSISGDGNGYGISAIEGNKEYLTIRNVVIKDFNWGINLINAFFSTIENVSAISNDRYGIVITSGQSNRIVRNFTVSNGGAGLSVSPRSIVKDNISNGNPVGIDVGNESVVSGNTANLNVSKGIVVRCPSVVTGNVANENYINFSFRDTDQADCVFEQNVTAP